MDTAPRRTFRSFVPIGPDEIAQGRPFTDPAETRADVMTIRRMVRRIGELLEAHPEFPPQMVPPYRVVLAEEERTHQIVVSQVERLRTLQELVVVGFFGHMRPGAESSSLPAVQQVDEDLIAEFPTFSGILSYSSLRLDGGNWGNVATFTDMAAMEAWNCNRRHFEAVRRLSAQHYGSIRLHVGRIEAGLSHGDIHLIRTKYFQYDTQGVWKALCDRTSVGRCPMSEGPPATPPV